MTVWNCLAMSMYIQLSVAPCTHLYTVFLCWPVCLYTFYVCAYLCACVSWCVLICRCLRIHFCVHMWKCAYAYCMHTCMQVWMCLLEHACALCSCTCMCLCVPCLPACVYMYVTLRMYQGRNPAGWILVDALDIELLDLILEWSVTENSKNAYGQPLWNN